MARIRTIKPDFFTSEDIVNLTPFARLLYIALWCEADRLGRLVWRPRTFKMRYLPADSVDIEDLCHELLSNDLIKLYGEGYAYIPSFLDHQHINPRETESKLPEPSNISTSEPRVNDASLERANPELQVQVGRKGKEGIYDASKFDAFYSAYPKKKNRGDAEKAFKAIKVTDELMAKILSVISISKKSRGWTKDEGEFIPYPASWLRAKAWEDELPTTDSNDLMAGVL